jgi:hypothetical protein
VAENATDGVCGSGPVRFESIVFPGHLRADHTTRRPSLSVSLPWSAFTYLQHDRKDGTQD